MEILSQLFGGVARVKVMRLFLFNEGKSFSIDDITAKTRLTKTTVQKELRLLDKIGMIDKKESTKKAKTTTKKKTTTKSKTTTRRTAKDVDYFLNDRFVYSDSLRQLLSLNDPVAHKDITEKLKRTGKLKLVIATGVFIGRPTDKVDLLIVGDDLRKTELERALSALETDVGREIAYTYFETDDFSYRLAVRDRLLRDILDYPHERIIDRLDF